MRVHNRQLLNVLLILVLLLISCRIKISQEGNVFEPPPTCKKIRMQGYDVSVVDKRAYIDHRKLKVPTMFIEGMMDRISPEIDYDLSRMFSEVLLQCMASGDRRLQFAVEILDITEEFSADKYTATEYVSTRLKVSVVDTASDELLQESEGEAWGSNKTTHARLEEIERMVEESLTRAFLDAMNKMNL